MRISRILKILILPMVILLAVSCNHDRNHPGRAFMADFDMYYAKSYEPYTANPVFADSITMQVAPAGTVSRGFIPYPYMAKSFDDQVLAGKELANPLEATAEVIQEGKAHYEIYCAICHGEKGDGQGYLFTSRKFTAQPTFLIGDLVKNKQDGEIYHVITVGSLSGLMGAHASQVRPENRWKIIHYVRTLSN
ncbi:MAG: c-type cytochrome [Bacteroidales bacterium]|nr:c-type cytochrome [Bacteroidales bacterium]